MTFVYSSLDVMPANSVKRLRFAAGRVRLSMSCLAIEGVIIIPLHTIDISDNKPGTACHNLLQLTDAST